MFVAAQEFRTVMWDMPVALRVTWYVLATISVVVFCCGVARPISRYRRAPHDLFPPLRELPHRFSVAAREALAQARIARRSRPTGIAHRAILYGWVVLFMGTVVLALETDVMWPILHVHFIRGAFYLVFKSALNVLGTAFVAGLLLMMIRRGLWVPKRLDYGPADPPRSELDLPRRRYRIGDWIFIGSLLTIALTGFLLEGIRIAMDSPGYGWPQFGGWLVAEGLKASGLGSPGLAALRHGLWWVHGLLAITVVAAIPFTKAGHMISSFASLVLRDDCAVRRVPAVSDAHPDKPLGYDRLVDVDAVHLIQLDACTRCGKCHEVCPANAAAWPLSPRDVVLALGETARSSPNDVPLSDTIPPDTVWSCMQCNACVDICPVGIEQAPILLQLRRHLVEDGELAPTLQATLEGITDCGNSFGAPRGQRGSWTAELGFPIKDARTDPVDVLWFVGDYASFDPRSQRVSQVLARLLTAAGVDFGILYDGETNAGNDVRRAGEEGLFEMLAAANGASLNAASFTRIMTTDPHSLNALRNDYRDVLDRTWQVVHHTQFLLELIESGQLAIGEELGYRVTYHDPCQLGRMNGEYEAPRKILELLGCDLVEMPRNRANSFCCGAGGGRIWMPDPGGGERPSESRIREALGLDEVDYFVVSCPKDVTMYEEAIRATGVGDKIQLRELTELIEAALPLGALDGASGRIAAR